MVGIAGGVWGWLVVFGDVVRVVVLHTLRQFMGGAGVAGGVRGVGGHGGVDGQWNGCVRARGQSLTKQAVR